MSERTIKRAFIKEVLTDEGKRFMKNQGLAMRKLLTFHTNDTFEDRDLTVESDDSYDGKLSIRVRANVRFLDMKTRVKGRVGSGKRFSHFPIYNRFAFGHYYSIANRLMFEFMNDVKARIKAELNQETHE